MIKREDAAELLLASRYTESSTWQKNVERQIAKLPTASFELRPFKILKFQDAPEPVNSDRTLGAVIINPAKLMQNANVLSLTLMILEAVEELNPNGYKESLHNLSPALRWWADNKYLIFEDDVPVSLNIKDVSHNHVNDNTTFSSDNRHANKSFWNELEERYKKIAESISDGVPDIQYNFEKPAVSPPLPLRNELAAEYAIAEEFGG
jgi:hypothetical protein